MRRTRGIRHNDYILRNVRKYYDKSNIITKAVVFRLQKVDNYPIMPCASVYNKQAIKMINGEIDEEKLYSEDA